MPLDYMNSVSLYLQLKEKIEEKILNGTSIDKVPSEREFMDENYISRSMIRQAINDLTREGTLVKKPCRGTLVVINPINDWFGSLSNETETIKSMGMTPDTKLVKTQILTLSDYL